MLCYAWLLLPPLGAGLNLPPAPALVVSPGAGAGLHLPPAPTLLVSPGAGARLTCGADSTWLLCAWRHSASGVVVCRVQQGGVEEEDMTVEQDEAGETGGAVCQEGGSGLSLHGNMTHCSLGIDQVERSFHRGAWQCALTGADLVQQTHIRQLGNSQQFRH